MAIQAATQPRAWTRAAAQSVRPRTQRRTDCRNVCKRTDRAATAAHTRLSINPSGTTMSTRNYMMLSLTALTIMTASGCAVTRGQETVGAYLDDTAITTAVKSRFVESKAVDAVSISVETLNGTVMLSGFAKTTIERSTAESLAWKVSGVTHVKNEIAVRP